MIYLFQGLGVEYNPFATSFNARSDQPTIEEVHSLLLSFNLILQRQNVVELLNVNMPQANLAAFANKKSFKTNQQNFKTSLQNL